MGVSWSSRTPRPSWLERLRSRCAASLSGLAREGGRVPVHPAPTSLTRQERAARNEATAAAVERLIAATVPGAGASHRALHQPPAPGAPRVLP